jgi:hypothetical protein
MKGAIGRDGWRFDGGRIAAYNRYLFLTPDHCVTR